MMQPKAERMLNMRRRIMDLGQRYLVPPVAGVFLAMGLERVIGDITTRLRSGKVPSVHVSNNALLMLVVSLRCSSYS